MRKHVKAILSALIIVSIVSSIFTGCAVKKDSANKTFTVGMPTDVQGLSPAVAYDHYTNAVLLQVVEGLFAYDSNSKIVPVLAKGYKVVNPTTYVYTIKNDVKFSDGTPLTADDVVFSLNFQKDPSTASDEAWMFANVDSITKTGDYEVTVKLKQADALWKDALATTAGLVFSKKYYLADKSTFGKSNGGIIGTGPYILKKWVSGSEIDLAKNDNYWNKSKSLPFDNIVYKIIADDTTRLRAAVSGQIDFAYGLSDDQLTQVKASKNLYYQYVSTFTTVYLTFNTKKEPFNDVNVRKAIYYAIDRPSILKNLVKESGYAANSLLIDDTYTDGKTSSWSDYIKNAPDYAYNIDTAKKYLAKSSKPNGFSFSLTYTPTWNGHNDSTALLIQQSLKQLGIDVKIDKVTDKQFDADKFGGNLTNGVGNYEALLDLWGSDFPDEDGILTPLVASSNITQGGSNDACYSNKELDQVLNQEIKATDNTQRTKLLQNAFSIVSEEIPYAPLYHAKNLFVFNKRIKAEVTPSYLYNLFYKDFKIQ